MANKNRPQAVRPCVAASSPNRSRQIPTCGPRHQGGYEGRQESIQFAVFCLYNSNVHPFIVALVLLPSDFLLSSAATVTPEQ